MSADSLDTQAIRARLETQMAVLLKREKAVGKHLRGQDGRLEADFSDRVAFTEMDEVLEQLDEDGRAEVRQIQAALSRIDKGIYGTCDACGETIAPRRLDIVPHTSRCVSCAQ